MLIRKCPKCENTIEYSSERTKNDAEKNNSKCSSCKRKGSRPKPNTECAICETKIYRRPCRIKDNNFCSYGCRNKYYSGDKAFKIKQKAKPRDRSREKELRREKKQRAIEKMGGKCQKCGYNKCPAALEFHHKDPNEKDFTIKDIVAGSWSKIEGELEKCIMLCANCHREEHWRINNESRTTEKTI